MKFKKNHVERILCKVCLLLTLSMAKPRPHGGSGFKITQPPNRSSVTLTTLLKDRSPMIPFSQPKPSARSPTKIPTYSSTLSLL